MDRHDAALRRRKREVAEAADDALDHVLARQRRAPVGGELHAARSADDELHVDAPAERAVALETVARRQSLNRPTFCRTMRSMTAAGERPSTWSAWPKVRSGSRCRVASGGLQRLGVARSGRGGETDAFAAPAATAERGLELGSPLRSLVFVRGSGALLLIVEDAESSRTPPLPTARQTLAAVARAVGALT